MPAQEITTSQATEIDKLPAIIAAEAELPALSNTIRAIVVVDDISKAQALELSMHVDDRIKGIEADLAEPIRLAKATHTALCERRTTEKAPWEALRSVLKDKVDHFAFAQREAIRKENERQAALAAARQAAEQKRLDARREKIAEKGGDPDMLPQVAAPVVLPQVSMPEKTTHLEAGKVTESYVWTIDIIDEALVPRPYCSPDLVKLRAAVKFGERSIPGCHVYERRVERHGH